MANELHNKTPDVAPGRFIRVLVVEDRPMARRLLESELDKVEDLRVVGHARNGREAVEAVRADPPDVVIMDIVMPQMDGIEALVEIRKFSQVPIIMFSGSHESADTMRYIAKKRGADGFVLKPSGPVSADIYKVRDELVQMIRSVVRQRGPAA